ncbi:transcriptional regulator [Natrialba asiatica DSM 12278]|uniref:Transcriptional regulator n=1 Tax=Natrialba asiatica (strain ATCC 700177 / DSM 12278 / JCM 9576 / FERM P-10747 / NBRC 102637 / 172P1) TaxID=29540 RepID=M0AFC6_NATA1|nr:transcriptional regulator [Natrialba asiatica DSM 12278]
MSFDPNVPWDLVSEVRRSRRKSQIINRLHEEPASASEIASEIGLQTDSVSNYFRELKKTDPKLIKCLTPDQPHHRLYGLTETGDTVYEYIPNE